MRKLLLPALMCGLAALTPGFGEGKTPESTPIPAQIRSDSATSLPAQTPQKDSVAKGHSRADTVIIAKHQFNHREQLIAGSVIMACLAGMLVVMNNYNPR